ncbi:hypothetical protein Mrub_2178 [Meiothermus ruber DSM 1279]|jgi:hypothetical protein|uniref:Lipoprotein n=2 Tax=Meiothermus ruber (strain ATCC 35948 / DSM 1279 / VKM B-1258 / 21) TaxID=504728 RepID=A0A806CRY5_MEIRD|nr:hypothetical protein Mrub_2178 [Meiothermus ruber DSM 1279]GAO75849.1 putative uncharacterized protein [Meiothermus ruber H328]
MQFGVARGITVWMMRVLFCCLVALLALSACAPSVTEVRRFDLIVQNQCTGPNQTVFFYINGEFIGTVRGSRLFPSLREGRYELRAEGTQPGQPGHLRFSRNLVLNKDTVWTLCP